MTHSVKPTLEHSSHANWQDGWIFVLACFFEKSWPFIFMLTKHDSCLSTNNLKMSFLLSPVYFLFSVALIEILCLTGHFPVSSIDCISPSSNNGALHRRWNALSYVGAYILHIHCCCFILIAITWYYIAIVHIGEFYKDKLNKNCFTGVIKPNSVHCIVLSLPSWPKQNMITIQISSQFYHFWPS